MVMQKVRVTYRVYLCFVLLTLGHFILFVVFPCSVLKSIILIVCTCIICIQISFFFPVQTFLNVPYLVVFSIAPSKFFLGLS